MRKARKEYFSRKRLIEKRSKDVYEWGYVTIEGNLFTVYTAKPKPKGRCYRIPLHCAMMLREADVYHASNGRCRLEWDLPF